MKPSHREILQQAQEAAQQENWSLLNQCLVQLLLSEERHDRINLLPAEPSNLLLDLALQVLEWGDFQDRWEVVKVFPSFGERAISPLIALLKNEDADSEAQWFAIRILSGFHHSAVVEVIVDLLKSSQSEELNGMAVTALGNMGDEAIAALKNLLQRDATRLLAVQALAQIRRPATVPLLLEVVQDANPQIRAAAIESLGSFHAPEIAAALVRATQDPTASVRRAAVTALGFCGAEVPQLVSHLRPLLMDLNLDVCRQTAIALGRLGTSDATKTLFQSLQSIHTPEPLAIEIVRALGWVASSEALQHLQRSLIQLPLPESVLQEILVVLGRVDQPELKPQATQILIDLLNHAPAFAQSTTARPSIALALGQLGDPSALNPLINLLADPDVTVRLHVISALKALAPEVAHQRLEQLSQSEDDTELRRGVAIALREWRL